MKATLLTITLALVIVACTKVKEEPVVVAPPVTIPAPIVPCNKEGSTIECQVAIGGCEYFKDQAELLAMIESSGFDHVVTLNGSVLKPGFGPGVSCSKH